MQVFSVPMELHIMAESKGDALAIARFAPSRIHADDGSGPHSLYVTAEDIDSVLDVDGES